MLPDELSSSDLGERDVWKTVCDELREIAWLASMIGGLSAAGVGLAVVLAGA
jgi:hypothetical protein